MRSLDFTGKVDVADLDHEPQSYKVSFDTDGLSLLAERLGLNSVSKLEAEFTLAKRSGRVEFRGRFEADVNQTCVVSLAPFDSAIAEEIELDLVGQEEADQRDADEDFLDPDAPEYDVLDESNLVPGEIVAQTLSMAIDPYPRRPEAVLEAEGKGVSVNEDLVKPDNPFAALKGIVDKN